MRDILTAIFFVLALNTIIFMTGQAITHINPSGEINYYDSNEHMNTYNQGNYSLKQATSTDLPSAEASVSNDGNFFTDIFSTMKNWFLDATGLGYLLDIINTVPNFLKAMGLPNEISFAIGYLWHVLGLFLIVAWLKSG